MYDTIEMKIPKDINNYSLDTLSNVLYNPIIRVNEDTQERVINGYLCGCGNCDLQVYANANYMHIGKRSLTKWIKGNNIETTTPKEIETALYMIGDMLDVDITKAIVTRFDIAVNLPVKKPVWQYINRFTTLRGKLPLRQTESSIYYPISTNETLAIYDKIKEAKEKRDFIPPFANENILRCEQRVLKPKNVIKRNICALELVENTFYNNQLDRLKNTLKSIKKQSFEINMDEIFGNGKKGFSEIAIIHFVTSLGGIENCLRAIDEHFANKPNERKKKHDIIKRIQEAMTNGEKNTHKSDDVLIEINNLIETINAEIY